MLENSEYSDVHQDIIRVLSKKYKDSEVMRALIVVLQTEKEDPNIGKVVIPALSKYQEEKITQVFIGKLKTVKDEDVRKMLVCGLIKKLNKKYDKKIIQALGSFLLDKSAIFMSDPDYSARQIIAHTLSKFYNNLIVKEIINSALKSEAYQIRSMAVKIICLSSHSKKELDEILISIFDLKNKYNLQNSDIKGLKTTIFYHMKNYWDEKKLVEILNSNNTDLIQMAVQILYEKGKKNLIKKEIFE